MYQPTSRGQAATLATTYLAKYLRRCYNASVIGSSKELEALAILSIAGAFSLETTVTIEVSYLRSIYYCKRRERTLLHQSRITDVDGYEDFAAFVEGFLQTATYPKPTDSKYECYGWTPTLFAPSVNRHDEEGVWRDGAFANDHLTLFIADLDNQYPERTTIQIADVAEALTELGLSHLLYTSFTSKPERPKFRIVIPVSRPLTCDEAFEVFLWFNAAFDRQLDGTVYDKGDHLYGPPATSTVVQETGLGVIDVDAFLALSRDLPEEDRNAVVRRSYEAQVVHEPTPEEKARAEALRANLTATDDVSIQNPRIFNPAWFELLSTNYIENSRSQSAFGLLKKCWLKSEGSLTFGDLLTLYREIDDYHFGYLSRAYGSHERDRGIRSIMRTYVAPRQVTTTAPAQSDHERRIAAWLRRLANKTPSTT